MQLCIAATPSILRIKNIIRRQTKKEKRRKKKDKSDAEMVAFLYACFFISIFVGLFLYSSTEKIIKDDINANGNYVISQIQQNFDKITSSVYTL